MRGVAVTGLVGALMLVPATADAEPDVRQEQFETLCTPTDPGLDELSGLTAIEGELYAIGDSGTDHRLAVLDSSCVVTRWLDVPVDPYDVEDLGSHDGRLWLSDTGDNLRSRDTVALASMDPSSGEGELHRLTFPDGPHDAETVLIEPGGRPVIVTKEVSGVSGIYVPAGDETVEQLASPGPTPLKRVGERAFQRTDTPGGPPFITGSILATGGAVSRDGAVAAVRTYTDVYLFPVTDGDVAGALTGDPVVVALPSQPQGEAVAFDIDGNLLVASEAAGGPLPPIHVLRDATSLVETPPATAATETPSGGRWSFGALAVAGVLALASTAYAFGRTRTRS
ncbi:MULTISPECIES: hypothetical protein [unclassified Rhodococcus (in: high G+C Gram-positive bacteria)]|uniref:hypothetical protein n=1 Tax=unclassified Rhodococcus (in: high G+C Gram-positive bacteria) TaxID=192944 RepID=UPI0021C0F385|nr:MULTISPECIES: hypothetical protein [unclassified Rhodococcus (in: high G+C Gram-positive bacteria)]